MPEFMGGSLAFKGDKKKKKKVKKKSKTSKHKQETQPAVDDDLTEAERKALTRKQVQERKEMEKLASKSHRERVEEFNEKLSNLTEHNDIPRVSAAGNG